jgi:hypothetical protein
MTVWAVTLWLLLQPWVGSVSRIPLGRVVMPTREACHAARQGATEFAAEELNADIELCHPETRPAPEPAPPDRRPRE